MFPLALDLCPSVSATLGQGPLLPWRVQTPFPEGMEKLLPPCSEPRVPGLAAASSQVRLWVLSLAALTLISLWNSSFYLQMEERTGA